MSWLPFDESSVRMASPKALAWARAIQDRLPHGIREVVATEAEVLVLFDPEILNHAQAEKLLSSIAPDETTIAHTIIEIPVCYDLGLDWEEVTMHTGLSKAQIIGWHEKQTYTANYGFMPGFLYLSGLDERLHCPRKLTPRTRVPAGAVGIGGSKTGIYSLDSPGGWQIIGQTPLRLFDPRATQPFRVPNGAQLRFKSISRATFDAHASH